MSGTKSSIRRGVDFGRLRRASEGPQLVWLALARVDDDDDAITFDANDGEGRGLGWLVDVTFSGGALDGDGPVPCRISSLFAANGATRLEPVTRGCEMLVAIAEGDPNASPVIIAQIHNGGDCKVPAEVNEVEIDEEYALATHIFVTPHAVDSQVDGTRRIKTGDTHRILGPLIELADEDASQSFVRGDEHINDANALKNALATFGANLAASTPTAPNGALTVADVVAAVSTLTEDLAAINFARALSEKIKGE